MMPVARPFPGRGAHGFWYHAGDFFGRTADLKNNKKGTATYAAMHAMTRKTSWTRATRGIKS